MLDCLFNISIAERSKYVFILSLFLDLNKLNRILYDLDPFQSNSNQRIVSMKLDISLVGHDPS